VEEKCKQIALLIASKFDTHLQILTFFGVENNESFPVTVKQQSQF